ncbi:MAG: PorT family protein [Flavobacteriales bacterium]|nr:PorT family protein [Flavobacteriales bacterium]
MKRHLLILFIAWSSLSVQGQVYVGHRAGMNSSNWVVSDRSPALSNTFKDIRAVRGFSFEVPLEVDVLGRGRVATGLGFTQKGWGWPNSDVYRCNYIQLPLSLGYSVPFGRFAVTPTVGAVASANVRGRYTWGNDFTTPTGRWTDEGTFIRLPDVELALLARTQFTYAIGQTRLALDVSYQYGLTNGMFNTIFTDVNGATVQSPRASQRTFAVQLGYTLPLSRAERKPEVKQPGHDSLAHQEDEKASRGIWIGQHGGLTRSTIAFSSSAAEEDARINGGAAPLLGATSALVVRLPLGEHFALQPELAFSQKGWNCRWFSRPTSANDLLRMNYVELPLLAYRDFGNGRLKPYALAGPTIAMGIGGRHTYGGFGNYPAPYANYQMDAVLFDDVPRGGYFNMWDLSAQIGGGVQLGDDRHALFLEVRYQHSFTDFTSEKAPWVVSDPKSYHRNWMVDMGYLLRWKR